MGRSVLICDDAKFARAMLGQILVAGGFTVIGEAGDGNEAVEKTRALKPDLVTMDIVMPHKSGIEAVREILAESPATRIMMCTAMGQEKLFGEALKAGAKACLVKPWSPAKVLQTAEEALG